jgi:hypothetical protein
VTLVNISQVKRVLLDEMTPDLRLRFLEILDKMVHGHLSVEAMQRVEPACDTAMKMLDEMKPLSIDDKCRLMMRWNVMATFCNLKSFDRRSDQAVQFWRADISASRRTRRHQRAFFEFQRDLYRQPTRGGFSTVGTIVTIHRGGLWDRPSWTDRTMPKNLDPFKLSSAARPLYWARRQRVASRKLLVSTVCTMTSSGQARAQYQSNIN